jgi:hypothetical protein
VCQKSAWSARLGRRKRSATPERVRGRPAVRYCDLGPGGPTHRLLHDDARDVTGPQRRPVLALRSAEHTHVRRLRRRSFTCPWPSSARVPSSSRWCISAAWQRRASPVPSASKMLALTMRREHDEPRSDRPRDAVPAATGGDEFVDILQVQQLLLDGGRGREPPPPPPDGRARLLDAFAAPAYYYGPGYGQPTSSVDDLVALWFAGGPSATGLSFYICLRFCTSPFLRFARYPSHRLSLSFSPPLSFICGYVTRVPLFKRYAESQHARTSGGKRYNIH